MGVGGQRQAPAALPTGKRRGVNCTRGWLGRTTGLNGRGKPRSHRDSIPEQPSPVAIRYTDCAILTNVKCASLECSIILAVSKMRMDYVPCGMENTFLRFVTSNSCCKRYRLFSRVECL